MCRNCGDAGLAACRRGILVPTPLVKFSVLVTIARFDQYHQWQMLGSDRPFSTQRGGLALSCYLSLGQSAQPEEAFLPQLLTSTCNRFKLYAKHTRHHSPATANMPRSENWRKPSVSLMMPMTGSTVDLRKP